MIRSLWLSVILLSVLCFVNLSCTPSAQSEWSQLKQDFVDPPQEYLPAVYWFWNAKIDSATIHDQLELMKASGTVSRVVILGWEGLETEYLSDEWFNLVGYACETARKLQLNIWLYDELRWPSGHAGGLVLKDNPEFQGKCLKQEMVRVRGGKEFTKKLDRSPVAVLAVPDTLDSRDVNHIIDLTENGQEAYFQCNLPPGSWTLYFYTVEHCDFKTTFTQHHYVDLLDSAAVDKFVRITYDEYYKRLSGYFGNVIETIITDEPGVYCDLKPWLINPQTVPWTPDFPFRFRQRNGYDLRTFLPFLWQEKNPVSFKVRFDFYQTFTSLFEQNYLRTLRHWTDEHGISLNIQPSHEETLKYSIKMMGDYFNAMRWSSVPGVDEVYSWDRTNLTPKIGSSAARACGYNLLWSEVFGAYGWETSPKKMKAVTDWLFTRGVNRFMLSSFYYAMEGNWRFEIPPSFFNHNPIWKYLPEYTRYVSRLSLMLGRGKRICQVALLYPTGSAQMVTSPLDESAVDSIDNSVKAIHDILLAHQIDFDFIDEHTFLNNINVDRDADNTILMPSEKSALPAYEALIVPSLPVMKKDIYEKIIQFAQNGGLVVFEQNLPLSIVDFFPDSATATIMESPGRQTLSSLHISSAVKQIPSIIKSTVQTDVQTIKHHTALGYLHQRIGAQDLYFFSNSDSVEIKTQISVRGEGIPQVWDPEDGSLAEINSYSAEKGRITFELSLAESGSKLILLDQLRKQQGVTHTVDRFISADRGNGIQRITLPEVWHFKPLDDRFAEEYRMPGSWTETQEFQFNGKKYHAKAHPYYSGTALYQQTVNFDDVDTLQYEYILEIEDVGETVEIQVNGIHCGTRLWPRWRTDITPAIRTGSNTIDLYVTNTLANYYDSLEKPYLTGENWGKVLKSGLLGAVYIQAYRIQESRK